MVEVVPLQFSEQEFDVPNGPQDESDFPEIIVCGPVPALM
jgi:hypothetical protein